MSEQEKKTAKALNLENRNEAIIKYSETQKAFDEIWQAFYMMANMGFIPRDIWSDFCDQCGEWYVNEEYANEKGECGVCISDGKTGGIVWEYVSAGKAE